MRKKNKSNLIKKIGAFTNVKVEGASHFIEVIVVIGFVVFLGIMFREQVGGLMTSFISSVNSHANALW